jgi:hypothetical protein
MLAAVPGAACLMAWFLCLIGKAKDYQDKSGEK